MLNIEFLDKTTAWILSSWAKALKIFSQNV